jgi:hypothetical protein
MAWILQGNPNRFDIDEYLSRYSFIYWSTPTNQKDFLIGDSVFIWRAGKDAGVVAYGIVKELPAPRGSVKTPEALGEGFWVSQIDEPSEVKVGIEIEEVRLSNEEDMLEREVLKTHPVLGQNRVITNPVGTVFRLNTEEEKTLLDLWQGNSAVIKDVQYSALEGGLQLKSHYRRERSRKLISLKKEQYKSSHGVLRCEICGLSFVEIYPESLGEDFIEVHHKTPLSQIEKTVKTTLDDLILVCANCHRMIHRTKDCERNVELLLMHFRNVKYSLTPKGSE